MGRLIRENLGLKSYKFRTGQLLSDVNKKRRAEKYKGLRKRFKNGRHLDILFTDEKLSTVECSFIRQNDRVLGSNSKGISREARVVKRTQKPASVIVWGGITATGQTPLVFNEQGVKINLVDCKKQILRQTPQSLDALKASLAREWHQIPQKVMSAASDCFYKRLRSCIQVKGDIFEGVV